MNNLILQPIGVIYSPFHDPEGMPIQPSGAEGARGWIELSPALEPGLKDLEGFSHLILLYYFNRTGPVQLHVKPFLDDHQRGVFATRAPSRPNPLGLSIVKLLAVEGHIVRIENVDILNETPLLDIKPYVPAFDRPDHVAVGWLEKNKKQVREKRADDRFA